jgi:hypothetical protein
MPAELNDLKHKSSPEVRALLKKEAHAELERIGFDKLRRARQQTQVSVAEKLNITQGTVSHIEKQSNFLLSTLKEYVRALGGHLELHAVFPDGDFILESLGKEKPTRKHRRP